MGPPWGRSAAVEGRAIEWALPVERLPLAWFLAAAEEGSASAAARCLFIGQASVSQVIREREQGASWCRPDVAESLRR